ncbi:MAG: hypothetical protein QOE28_743, partial [Solirubrobacteraceae bacterium]|nr:hypothetical protein [Solirubrobacteraceae bacterium]
MPQSCRLLLCLLALIVPVSVVLPASAAATTYTVDSTGDLPDADSNDGICKDTTDPPANAKCTLRAAIMQANQHSGADAIAFGLAAGLQTIAPLSQLPPIVEQLDVNGTSQAGWAGSPLIQLSGASAPSDTDGLRIQGGTGSTVRGLIINGFRIGLGIEGPGQNRVWNDWVGTDATGMAASPNRRSGVYVFASPANVIGGDAPEERNVVSGNGVAGVGVADEWGKGIEIFGAGADGNQVIGNYVGTDITGSGPLGNLRHGVWIGSGAGTLGTPAGADVGDGSTNGRNVIAANGEEGIYVLDSPSVKVRGNLIGLGLDGRAAGNGFRGIAIENAQDAVIGGATTGERNVVSANGFSPTATEEFEGIIVFGPNAKNVKVQGNYIGTNLAGDAITDPGGAPTGNKSSGVSLATRTDLGGATDGLVGGTLATQRNVISGNDVGVVILNRATHNHIEGNYIGTDATGTATLPNHFAGAMIYAA